VKKILLVTRPIAPPWDEASKNFAYNLALNMPDFEFGLLTNGILENLPQSIRQYPIYTSNILTNYQRARLLKLTGIKNNFDIIHIMLTPSRLNSFCFQNFIINKRHKTIQTVATLREDLLNDEDFKKILFADTIVTYSKYAKNKLNNLGFTNVEQIYPGIDLAEYRKKEKNKAMMKKHNFSNADFVINYSGEYSRLGAIDDVIDSFIEITDKIGDARLSLALRVKNNDDSKKKMEIISKLKKCGLLDKTAFHDDASYKMSDIYNLCDVSIFPVREMKGKFDVPLAVIEAMACEKPVIISDLPILQEFANGHNSAIIKSGDTKQLMDSILDLYRNKEKRQMIGKSARIFVEENFDIKKISEKYMEIYRNL
jgi:glycosyltransferase involved in cell wall biosynthesis